MSLYKTEAIILRVIPYQEADKILTLLSPADGKISAIAKGSRKVKSRFGGRLEPFCRVDLVLYKGKNFHTVTQVALIKANKNIRQDYSKYLIASSAVELVDKVTFSGQNEEAIFNLLNEMLGFVNAALHISQLHLLYFDWQIIKLLGLFPPYEDLISTAKPLTIELLKSIMKLNLSELNKLKTDSNTIRHLSVLTKNYMDSHLNTKLKSRSYIE